MMNYYIMLLKNSKKLYSLLFKGFKTPVEILKKYEYIAFFGFYERFQNTPSKKIVLNI